LAIWRLNEYVLIDLSLSALSWRDLSSQRQLKFIQLQHLFLSLVTGSDDSDEYPSRLEDQLRTLKLRRMKQNISTTCPGSAGAESPCR
jgi:hypothetical protein